MECAGSPVYTLSLTLLSIDSEVCEISGGPLMIFPTETKSNCLHDTQIFRMLRFFSKDVYFFSQWRKLIMMFKDQENEEVTFYSLECKCVLFTLVVHVHFQISWVEILSCGGHFCLGLTSRCPIFCSSFHRIAPHHTTHSRKEVLYVNYEAIFPRKHITIFPASASGVGIWYIYTIRYIVIKKKTLCRGYVRYGFLETC